MSFSREKRFVSRFDTCLACATRRREEGRRAFTPSVKRKSDFRMGRGRGETSVPSPAWPIVADRSIDRGIVSARLIYLRRETRVKREMDSKEDRFGTADLTRYPINRRPAFVHTPSPSSLPYYPRLVHVSGMRWRGANLDRPTLRSTASPPLLFCDRGKFYFQFQRSFRPGRFVERKMHR